MAPIAPNSDPDSCNASDRQSSECAIVAGCVHSLRWAERRSSSTVLVHNSEIFERFNFMSISAACGRTLRCAERRSSSADAAFNSSAAFGQPSVARPSLSATLLANVERVRITRVLSGLQHCSPLRSSVALGQLLFYRAA